MDDENKPQQDEWVGNPLPPLTLEGWSGDATSMDDFQGQIIVLDFWATWCQPCLGAIPQNNRLAEDYADRGVRVVGICATTGSETMNDIAEERGIQYPIAKDVGKASEKALGVRWFPCYFLVDRQGKLQAAHVNHDAVVEALHTLLDEEASA